MLCTIRSILFSLLLLPAFAAEQPSNLELFLLTGQSNMAGRGVIEPRDAQPLPRIYSLGKDLTWTPAIDPLHSDKPIAGVGLGRSFARALTQSDPDASIGLIPAAFGGTSLNEWVPGGKLFTDAVTRARAAQKNGQLRAILWHQGEADSNDEALARSYRDRFTKFITALRLELNAPHLPVVVGELGEFLKSPYSRIVNEQLATIPLTVPHTAFVSSAGLHHKGDDLHFDTPSLREFGRRYELAFLSLDPTWGKPKVPGFVIDHSPQASGRYIGSPSIVILPNGDYVASHDFFGPRSGFTQNATSRIFNSQDRGQHWTQISEIEGAFWGTLFVQNNALYLIGTHHEYGDTLIRRSMDGGKTWTTPIALLRGRFHCAPQPVLVHNGRIWRAMEDAEGGGGWGKHFRAFMMSAPVDADLLQPASWTSSNPLPGNTAWLDGKFGGWLEGNAVATPDGEIVDILRVDYPAGGKAAIVRISRDGKTATFDPATGFIDLPEGAKKFTIRYDPITKRYWSITNAVLPRDRGPKAASIRNTVALISSPDLSHWTIHSIELHHPDPAKHAFQYVDWQFDGADLVAAVRTAFDDDEDGAHNAHDANYLTFTRIPAFRDRKMADGVSAYN